MKFVHRKLPSKAMSFGTPLICKHCKQSHDNFLQYQKSTIIKCERIKSLEDIMNPLKTPKILIIIIKAGIMLFYNNITPHSHTSNMCSKIMARQIEIEWDHFALGRISKNIIETMNHHYRNPKIES